ncbi:cytochrome P450 71A4-like [Cynara cardunculus var. scolymus]|uniref:cytochrome P450 71A4-like n=1 Tax=Cynara cardunculus var. scolymus TaxID=59895 RepID=UPI000D624881|nr:cytochrome P450 71A4-like [Cynara cardunculus var. scolymus]
MAIASLHVFLLPSCSLIMIILMIFIGFKWISFRSKPRKTQPPSPPKLPIIGNLHQLGSNPHRSLHALSQKHGPIMFLHFGSLPTLVASSAEVAREIMKTHDLSFSSRPSLTIPNIVLYGGNDIAFSPYGEYWRQLKSIVVLHLLSNSRVKSFRQVREEEMAHMISILVESCGSLVNLSESIISLTNNVICRAALGRTYRGSKFTELLRKLMDLLGVISVGNYISWLSWVDRLIGVEGKAKKTAKEFDEFLKGVLEEHINKEKMVDGKSDESKDLVDILLEIQREKTTGFTLQRDNLKAVILDVFGGGVDTTSTTIEWAISELVKHPRVMKKLQQEVTEIAQGRSMIPEEDLEKMEYLKAVIKETLRLHVPVPLLVPRESTQDVKLMGYDIPAGTQVIINAWAIGRDSTSWEEAIEFRPERFLKNSIDYKGFHYEWLPFGAGRRGCPGIQFGVVIVELALANIVYKFDLALPNGAKNEDLDMSETYGIVLHRKSSLLVNLHAR